MLKLWYHLTMGLLWGWLAHYLYYQIEAGDGSGDEQDCQYWRTIDRQLDHLEYVAHRWIGGGEDRIENAAYDLANAQSEALGQGI